MKMIGHCRSHRHFGLMQQNGLRQINGSGNVKFSPHLSRFTNCAKWREFCGFDFSELMSLVVGHTTTIANRKICVYFSVRFSCSGDIHHLLYFPSETIFKDKTYDERITVFAEIFNKKKNLTDNNGNQRALLFDANSIQLLEISGTIARFMRKYLYMKWNPSTMRCISRWWCQRRHRNDFFINRFHWTMNHVTRISSTIE